MAEEMKLEKISKISKYFSVFMVGFTVGIIFEWITISVILAA